MQCKQPGLNSESHVSPLNSRVSQRKQLCKKWNVLKWNSLILYWTFSYDKHNHDSNHLHHDHDYYVRGKFSLFATSCPWCIFCLRCFHFTIIQKDILKIWPLVTISLETSDNVVVSCQTHCVLFFKPILVNKCISMRWYKKYIV